MPKCRGGRSGFRLGTRAAARACRGTARSSTRRTCAASPSCIPRCRRSCAAPSPGSARKEVIDYIQSLGVTSVELLPVHTFVNDRHLLDKGLTNYWGYNTIGFFAPDPRYSAVPAFVFCRVQGDGGAPARRRPRGDPRRGLQPHRRRQRARADAVVQGHRQRVVLPAAAGPAALLHQRHRHRQHAEPQPSARACRWSPTACATG